MCARVVIDKMMKYLQRIQEEEFGAEGSGLNRLKVEIGLDKSEVETGVEDLERVSDRRKCGINELDVVMGLTKVEIGMGVKDDKSQIKYPEGGLSEFNFGTGLTKLGLVLRMQ